MNPPALRRIDGLLWPAAIVTAKAGAFLMRSRHADPRPVILRPGGMGDLILLCVAAEELGCDLRRFFWIIERRSSVWARHLGLDYACYDQSFAAQHWRIAGRFSTVVNTEQFFGLSQATALLACGRHSRLTCFATNRASWWAGRRVPYDPDRTHESVAFQNLLVEALGIGREVPAAPAPRRRSSAAGEIPVVGLAGLQSESRAFSEEQWARFIHAWGKEAFWIASSETDRPMARRLVNRFPKQARLFEGHFGALCDLIRNSAEVLTVDGGFLHIASYYGVPVTGIFTSGRDRKWAPLAHGSHIARRRDLDCQPCTWFGQVPSCPHRFACKELDFEKHVRTAS